MADTLSLGFVSMESLLGHGANDVGACFEGEERPAFPIYRSPFAIFTGEDCVPELEEDIDIGEADERRVSAAIGRLLDLLGEEDAPSRRFLARIYIKGGSKGWWKPHFPANLLRCWASAMARCLG